MGPNGSGKSTLLSAIMGLRNARVCGGSILFNGLDITNMPSYKRAKLGIALAHQSLPDIKGVRLRDVANAMARKHGCSDCTLLARSITNILNHSKKRDNVLVVHYSGKEISKV